jgi:PAS domain S-box-containing protein
MALTSGQVDSIITPDGRAHLLRPAEEIVRRNERRLQAMIEGAGDVIVVVGRGGGIVFQNRATSRWVGYGTGSLLGRNLFQLVHPDDLFGLYSGFFNVIEHFQEEAFVQFRLYHHVEDYREIEATIGKLNDGSLEQVVLICRDLARRKSASSPPAPGETTTQPLTQLPVITKPR